ncbi:Gfo/Idh/MocA family protein [Mangrovicoccus sp. HB161399]|uniref:Gfo/Idh/MocA family protein n=1 Tax=Mangrovicoccus sp. HB161399 TaxID=2720392 RepID=UPI00352E6B79
MLGTGGVSRKFVLGLRAVPGHSAVAAASRSPESAARFARDFGLEATDYASAAAWADADAVYVATRPSEHEAHALAAIAVGKPVLVEKPFALDVAAAARIADAAQSAGVFAMEAMWTRFLPLLGEIRRRIAAGELGALRAFEANFFGNDLPDPAASLFDPARGGGALMHRGIYGLSLARHLLGPVAELQAMGRTGATGEDEDCALTLRHEGGAISTIRAGLRAPGINAMRIYGEAAALLVEPPIYRPSAARLISMAPRKGGTSGAGARRFESLKEGGLAQGLNQRLARLKAFAKPPGQGIPAPFAGNGYGHEAEAVAQAVRAGQGERALMPLSERVEIMELADRALQLMRDGEAAR